MISSPFVQTGFNDPMCVHSFKDKNYRPKTDSEYEEEEEDEMEGMVGAGIGDRSKQVLDYIRKKVPNITTIQGQDMLNSIINYDNPNIAKGHPGEKHLWMVQKNGKPIKANFCGPGTDLDKRKKDKPVNDVDAVCQRHDYAYADAKTDAEFRKADMKMIRELETVRDLPRWQVSLMIKGLRAKMRGEDLGVFDKQTFTELAKLPDNSTIISRFIKRIVPSARRKLEEKARQFAKRKGKPRPRPLPIKSKRPVKGEGVGALIASIVGPIVIDTISKAIKKRRRKRRK